MQFTTRQEVLDFIGREQGFGHTKALLGRLAGAAEPGLLKVALKAGVPIPRDDLIHNPVNIALEGLLSTSNKGRKHQLALCIVLLLLRDDDISHVSDRVLDKAAKPYLREALLDLCGRRFCVIGIRENNQDFFTEAQQYAYSLFGSHYKTRKEAKADLKSLNTCITRLETILDNPEHALWQIMENKTGIVYVNSSAGSVAVRALQSLYGTLKTLRDEINGLSDNYNPLLDREM